MDNRVFIFVIQILVLLLSVSIHESAHGWMADRCGDPTARIQGRITLNPIYHIDLIGSIIFPILMYLSHGPVFGWAKPVPVNVYNLRHSRRDHRKVSAAGPISNLLTAAIALGIFFLIKQFVAIQSNLVYFIFIFLIDINIFLAIFNFIPVPPLDGSWILESMLKGRALEYYKIIKPYGFMILLLVMYIGVLDFIALPIQRIVIKLILGTY